MLSYSIKDYVSSVASCGNYCYESCLKKGSCTSLYYSQSRWFLNLTLSTCDNAYSNYWSQGNFPVTICVVFAHMIKRDANLTFNLIFCPKLTTLVEAFQHLFLGLV